MILNSFEFLRILPIVLLVYVIVAWAWRGSRYCSIISASLLTVISYTFIISFQPACALFLFLITAATYGFGLLFERHKETHRARIWIVFGAILILLPLIIFKYADFIADAFLQAFHALGLTETAVREPASFGFVIPIGISFFTFQSIGYVWDVYRGKTDAEHNFIFYMLFVAFFPQIASGPISKASELLPQIKNRPAIVYSDIAEGVWLMALGFFLKAVVADRLATYVNPVYADYANFSGLTCFLASIFYSIQLYGDFAGYSLMAVGVGRLFGYRLINNFQRPYFAHSVTEFWRRWHISLTRWLKENVYIPLGGNRRGKARTYGNIIATFAVSGIWHGANYTFIIWGLIHGAVQCVEKWFGLGDKPKNRLVLTIRILLTFLIVNFAWIFFRMPTLKDAVSVMKRIVTFAPGASLNPSKTTILLIGFALISLFAAEFIREYFPQFKPLKSTNAAMRVIALILLLFIVLTVGVLDSSQFIYVNF